MNRVSFPTTHWTLVSRAGGSDPAARQALDELLRQYLPAMRWYLCTRRRLDAVEADDLLQEFVADKVLRRGLVRRADRKRGRFRGYLVRALDRFFLSWARRTTAPAWAGGIGVASLSHDRELLSEALRSHQASQAADLFDIAWARQVLELALHRMRQECESSRRHDLWVLFEARVLAPTIGGRADAEPYREILRRAGLTVSAEQAFNLTVTAKRMFRRHLRAVVGEYAVNEDEVDEEIRFLQVVLSHARA